LDIDKKKMKDIPLSNGKVGLKISLYVFLKKNYNRDLDCCNRGNDILWTGGDNGLKSFL
jgi:hypothetical protein